MLDLLVNLLETINAQIKMLDGIAEAQGVCTKELMDLNGNFLLTPLLLAKAQTVQAMVIWSKT